MQLAIDFHTTYPKAISRDFYVDDFLSGSESIAEVTELCNQVACILKSACFDLRKWKSNSVNILENLKVTTDDLHFSPRRNISKIIMTVFLFRQHSSEEVEKYKKKSGKAQKGKNVYMYAKQLAFLSDVIHRRPTDASLDNMNPSSPNNETGSASEISTVLDSLQMSMLPKKKIEDHTIRQKQKSQTEKLDYDKDNDKLLLLSLLPFIKLICCKDGHNAKHK